MHSRREDQSVFSTSALDLFASALGAFILIVLILFPHYQNEGPAAANSEVEEAIQKRREDGGKATALLMAAADADRQVDVLEGKLASVESEIKKVISQIADVNEPEPALGEEEESESGAEAPAEGVQFSILGLETNAKTFVLLIDQSGSMVAHGDLVRRTVFEILEPLTTDNKLMIMGYHQIGNIRRFPAALRPETVTPEFKNDAMEFVRRLSFSGGTPTNLALQQAMTVRADAVILISDGEPTDGKPSQIIRNLEAANRGSQQRQVHTVAIGDYTENQNLTRFLMEIAARNNGNFVGVQAQRQYGP